MEVHIAPATGSEPIERIHVISIIIRTFKGRRNVEAHLFRATADIDALTGYPWEHLIGKPSQADNLQSCEEAKRMIAEAFTPHERDMLLEYLQNRYGSYLKGISAGPLSLPIPWEVTALSSIPEGKTLGFIRFADAVGYPLPFAVKGFYDLAQHKPMLGNTP